MVESVPSGFIQENNQGDGKDGRFGSGWHIYQYEKQDGHHGGKNYSFSSENEGEPYNHD